MSEIQEFIDWYGWISVSEYSNNGHQYIEYANFEVKAKAGDVRCTIDGEEIFQFTRKSRCHDAGLYADVIDGVDKTFCDTCKQEVTLTYLDNADGL